MKMKYPIKKLITVSVLLAGALAQGLAVAEESGPGESPGRKWLAEKSKRTGTPVSELLEADKEFTRPLSDEQYTPELKANITKIWMAECSACHGKEGEPPEGLKFKKMPRGLSSTGMAMGFLFGGDKMRAGIFKLIRDGRGPNMPAFGKKLTREQLWGLVRFIDDL